MNTSIYIYLQHDSGHTPKSNFHNLQAYVLSLFSCLRFAQIQIQRESGSAHRLKVEIERGRLRVSKDLRVYVPEGSEG